MMLGYGDDRDKPIIGISVGEPDIFRVRAFQITIAPSACKGPTIAGPLTVGLIFAVKTGGKFAVQRRYC
jgi:hypothetical protein